MDTPRDRRTRQGVLVLSAGALAGVLIWSKLRLVTDIPRSAYAVPESRQPAEPSATMPVAERRPDAEETTGTEHADD